MLDSSFLYITSKSYDPFIKLEPKLSCNLPCTKYEIGARLQVQDNAVFSAEPVWNNILYRK